MGSIYKITNTVNGKSYIGQTIYDAEKARISKHLSGSGSQLVKQAIEKYGKDAFTYDILHDGIIPEFLDALEIEAIAEFNTIAPHGYNLTYGGEGCSPSKQTRKKMSKAKREQKGENNPFYGKTHSEETRRVISEKNKGRERSEEHRQKHAKALRGRKFTKEHRLNISKSLKGRKRSEKDCRKISESKRGKNHPFFGEILSKEHRRNVSEARLGMSQEALTILIGWLKRDGWTQNKIACELKKSWSTIDKYKP